MINIDKIKSSDLWYVIGYIATDGNLSSDGRHLNITSKDREHLYTLRKALNLRVKIGSKARGGGEEKKYSYLQFGDVHFYQYLLTIGLSTKKSLALGAISINDAFFIDFLRGVIDGDGNISTWLHRTNNHRQWCLRIFSASPVFIRWLNEKVREKFNLEGKLYTRITKNRVNPHYIIKFGKKAAAIILKSLYYPNCLSLERKFLKAQLCLH